MKSCYKLGELIRNVDVKNKDLHCNNLRGLSMTKEFRPSTSNIVGTDLSKYKIVAQKQFACDFMSTIRVHKMPIAFNTGKEEILVSPAYAVFEVVDEKIILPEYLMMWFSRTEFDRYADFRSDAAIRGGFGWNELCETSISIPCITDQYKIVFEYQAITERIALKKKINDNLEATVQAIFKSEFIDYERANYSDYIEFEFGKYPATWNLVDLDTAVDVRDGTHASPSPTESGKYLITSRHLLPYAVDRSDAYFISEADFKKANERSKVEYGDILFSMIGTIGIISFITDKEVDFAIKNVGLFRTSQNPTIRYFILSYLKSKIVENYIASYMSGSTQSYVSLNVLRKIPLILPTEDVLQHFEKQVAPLYASMIENTHEISKLNDLKDVITTSLSSR